MEPQNPQESSRTPDILKEEDDGKDEKHQTAANLEDEEEYDVYAQSPREFSTSRASEILEGEAAADSESDGGDVVEDDESEEDDDRVQFKMQKPSSEIYAEI